MIASLAVATDRYGIGRRHSLQETDDVKLMPKSAALSSLGVLLAAALAGCGSDDTSGGAAEAGAQTEAPADADEPSGDADAAVSEDQASTEQDCDLPEGLSERLVHERQLVLSLAMAGGDNFETVESTGAPEPETFRSVADVLDGLDLSGIATNTQFDEPGDVITGLDETADLLEAALAAGTDTTDPAWQALSEFYTQEFFAGHSASVGYYLTEAGCI